MAHAPLLRTNTAPVFQHSTDGVARLTNTLSMGSGPRGSQLSGSTAFDSSTSLSSLSTAKTAVAPANGQVMATTNIINQKADASRSLYQICVALKQRLTQVPGFEEYIRQMEEWAADMQDPVESVWKLLRTGVPLLTIYNCLQPETPLTDTAPEGVTEEKRAKIAILSFVGTTSSQLKPPPPDKFIINDVMGTDTTGFLKVCASSNPRPLCAWHAVSEPAR